MSSLDTEVRSQKSEARSRCDMSGWRVLSCGLAMGLLGIGIGQLLTSGIANIPKAELDMAYVPWQAVAVAFVFSGTVGIFFGMFPAIKAARLDPIEALRHE
jgi:putative ABC transport system permease protein